MDAQQAESQRFDLRSATEDDLLAVVAGKWMESGRLDFKSADTFLKPKNPSHIRDELSKDVSSFANSDGGTIIYGIDEADHVATKLRGIPPTALSKETLEQLIFSNISPRMPDLHIQPVPLEEVEPGSFAYVVTIAKGATAYQACDKRYYRRYNFRAVPMDDYEVRDVMNRTHGPRLRLVLHQTHPQSLIWDITGQVIPLSMNEWSGSVTFRIDAENTGNIALHALFRIYVPVPDSETNWSLDGDFSSGYSARPPAGAGSPPKYSEVARAWGAPRDHPIFTGTSVRLSNLSLQAGQRGNLPFPLERRLYWECIAQDMNLVRGGWLLRCLGPGLPLQLRDLTDVEVAAFFG